MSPLPRIAIDYTPAYEQGGGIGRYVRDLVSALALVDTTTDYRLFVAGADKTNMPALPDTNFSFHPTRLSPKWLARIWHRARLPIPVEMITGQVDLYHATDFVLPPHLPNTHTLLTVHDLSFVRVPDAATPTLKQYLDTVVPRSVKRASHILADSEATKRDLVDLYAVDPVKVTVLLSGVDRRFLPVDFGFSTMRRKYKIDNRPYIFTIGTVQPRKNYVRLIHALANLRQLGYDLNLVIAGGRGWLADPIYEAIEQTKLGDYVHMIGFVDDGDLPTLYSDAACVAFPSLYEGFGFPVLEAMACGTPVITSNVSSLPEVAGDAAIMVDPYSIEAITEAIQRVMDDTTLRENMVEAGLQHVKSFTWERAAKQLHQVYMQLL